MADNSNWLDPDGQDVWASERSGVSDMARLVWSALPLLGGSLGLGFAVRRLPMAVGLAACLCIVLAASLALLIFLRWAIWPMGGAYVAMITGMMAFTAALSATLPLDTRAALTIPRVDPLDGLWGRVPESSGKCHVVTHRVAGEAASLLCSPGGAGGAHAVEYSTFASNASLTRIYERRLANAQRNHATTLQHGRLPDGVGVAGRYFIFRTSAATHLEWTQSDGRFLARAYRRDQDVVALTVWLTIGVLR